MQVRIRDNDLRRIIREELVVFHEQVDHAGIKNVVTGAQKLLAAIESFKSSAPPAAINATVPHLDELATVLENMLSTPGSYVQKTAVQKVTLRNTGDSATDAG